MRSFQVLAFSLCLVCLMGLGVSYADVSSQGHDVTKVLDALHEAASKADGKTYFALYAEDAVFFGTDKTERWPLSEFIPYGQKRFDTGTGWTYKPVERNIFFSEDGKIAWFDERLDHSMGEARGTGVLRLHHDGWKIVQYNLSFPVPNDLFDPIYSMIQIYENKK